MKNNPKLTQILNEISSCRYFFDHEKATQLIDSYQNNIFALLRIDEALSTNRAFFNKKIEHDAQEAAQQSDNLRHDYRRDIRQGNLPDSRQRIL